MKKKSFIKCVIMGIHLFLIPLFSNAQFRVVGYLTTWQNYPAAAASVDYSIVTHVNIAFLNPITGTNGTLSPTSGLSTAVTSIHNGNAKVLASLGGSGAFSSNPDWPTLINSTNRGAFIHKLMQFMQTYNLDGYDVDFEGSDVNSDYAGFIKQLSDSLKPKQKLLTAAVATWYGSSISNSTLYYFNWVNIMSYDAYGTWTGPGEHSTYSNAVSDLNYWATTKGLPWSQLVLGVPSYGYKWTGKTSSGSSSMNYCTIVTYYPNRAANQDTIGIIGGNPFISYNGIPTIKKKTDLAVANASGIMMWTLQDDCPTSNPNSLLLAIKQELTSPTTAITPSQSSAGSINFYPNPFTGNATISLNLTTSGQTKISLFDVTGREIYVVKDDFMTEGTNEVTVPGNVIPKGFYICRIIQDGIVITAGVTKE